MSRGCRPWQSTGETVAWPCASNTCGGTDRGCGALEGLHWVPQHMQEARLRPVAHTWLATCDGVGNPPSSAHPQQHVEPGLAGHHRHLIHVAHVLSRCRGGLHTHGCCSPALHGAWGRKTRAEVGRGQSTGHVQSVHTWPLPQADVRHCRQRVQAAPHLAGGGQRAPTCGRPAVGRPCRGGPGGSPPPRHCTAWLLGSNRRRGEACLNRVRA